MFREANGTNPMNRTERQPTFGLPLFTSVEIDGSKGEWVCSGNRIGLGKMTLGWQMPVFYIKMLIFVP